MKYLGSKSRIVNDILPYIQGIIDKKELEIYVEPFCGGANVIDKVFCNHRIAVDNNKYLVALLDGVANKGYTPLETVDKDLYDLARQSYYDKDGKYTDTELGNIGFLASYNGRFFDGGFAKAGWEITKTGKRYRDYYQESKRNLLQQAKNLEGIKFYWSDYSYFLSNFINGMPYAKVLFYCDPPYEGTKKYATSIDFDHAKFWDWMRKLSKDAYVIISEENAPEDFICIWDKAVSRSIKARDKSKASEKLFVYGNGLLKDEWG